MSDLRPRDRSVPTTPLARHGQLKKSSAVVTVFKLLGIALAVVLVAVLSISSITVAQIAKTIQNNSVAIDGEQDVPADVAKIKGGFNVLVVGSDECTESCKGFGVRASRLNDVNILLHVSEDQTNAVAVSLPRDMVMPIPSCPRDDGSGTVASAMSAQPLNVALSDGGLNCVVKTVAAFTGLPIQYAGLITFKGVVAMSNAVGGVPVCVTKAVTDSRTGLDMKAGTTYLKGSQALAFLRARHAFGDGSDLSRIGVQQVYMSSLLRTLQSKSTLSSVPKLYSLATAASQNMQLSTSLGQINTMVSMALALKDIPLNKINFVSYPSTTGVGGIYAGKVAPVQPDATQMMDYIKSDKPFTVKDLGTRGGVVADPTSTPTTTPTGTSTPTGAATKDPSVGAGTSAEQETCAAPKN